MTRTVSILMLVALATCNLALRSQDKPRAAAKKIPDGVYRVLRDGPSEKDVLPLKEGEAIVVDHRRYVKGNENEPRHYVVVRSAPDVLLDLAREPIAVGEGTDIRIVLQLRPKPAEALEQVTREYPNGQLTIVLGGEVVTTHKIRSGIKDGDVQITSCTAGAADFLLKQRCRI